MCLFDVTKRGVYKTAHPNSTLDGRFCVNPILFMKKAMAVLLWKMHHKLIDSQIEVYLAWARKNQRWDLNGDQDWLELFVEVTQLEDILDVRPASMEIYEIYIDTRYGSTYMADASKKAVFRFIRFYNARTKSFTNRPRYALMTKDAGLSTLGAGIL